MSALAGSTFKSRMATCAAATCKRTRDFTAEDPCAASDDDDHSGEVVHADELRQNRRKCALRCRVHVPLGALRWLPSSILVCSPLQELVSVTQVRSGLTRVQ